MDTFNNLNLNYKMDSSHGDGGFLHIPYDYILNPNLASDFWIIKIVA